VVAEVPAQLAGDRDDGERGERPAPRVVPVDGLDQAEPRHLFQVLQRLAAVPVAPGQPPGERQGDGHHGVPGGPAGGTGRTVEPAGVLLGRDVQVRAVSGRGRQAEYGAHAVPLPPTRRPVYPERVMSREVKLV
jgi:hypothetical protein